MFAQRFLQTLALSFALVTAISSVGCQSVRGALPNRASTSVSVPPLPVSTGEVVLASGSQFAAAPPELNHARLQSPVTPTSAPQSAAAAGPEHPPTPANPSPPLPPTSPQPRISAPLPQSQNPGCLPSEADWRAQMEEQTKALLTRLSSLENELASARSELQAVNQALEKSNRKINELNQSVAHWKNRVQQLEEEIKAQQLADLKSLDELTAAMHQVLLKQQSTSSQTLEAAK